MIYILSKKEFPVFKGSHRITRFDGLDFWSKGTRISLDPGSTILSFDNMLPPLSEVKVVNLKTPNKYDRMMAFCRNGPCIPGLADFRFDARDIIGRSNNGNILEDLKNQTTPKVFKYWQKRVEISEEWSFIVVGGKVVKVGKKEPINKDPHPWVRTELAGWGVNYEAGPPLSKTPEACAMKAVSSLGLTMGIVSVGFRPYDGGWYTFDVDSANFSDPVAGPVFMQFVQEGFVEPAPKKKPAVPRPRRPRAPGIPIPRVNEAAALRDMAARYEVGAVGGRVNIMPRFEVEDQE